MAKPNYQFEKRRRELDKKAKKAEKLRLKAAVSYTHLTLPTIYSV